MAPPGKRGWAFYGVVTLPSSLDIVWCRFPEDAEVVKPEPKPRPALVRTVLLGKGHQRAWIEVSYGTSKLKEDSRLLDLIIRNATEMAAMGLPQAIRFDLDSTVVLPWAKEFFVARPGYSTPIIGHMTQSACMQLETLKVLRRQR